MARLRRPKRREPTLPPWRNTECSLCQAPVRVVLLTGEAVPDIAVCMKPAPLNERRATVAAVPINGRLEGRLRAIGVAPKSEETLWIPHQAICPEVPRPVQLAIPIEQESQ